MPFLTLYTSLSLLTLSADLMPRLVLEVGPVLKKPVEGFSWLLEADKAMAQGPNPSGKPFIWLKLETVNSYRDPEMTANVTATVYNYLKNETKLDAEQIVLTFYNFEPHMASRNGLTIAQMQAPH